jgi:hypothetical protein
MDSLNELSDIYPGFDSRDAEVPDTGLQTIAELSINNSFRLQPSPVFEMNRSPSGRNIHYIGLQRFPQPHLNYMDPILTNSNHIPLEFTSARRSHTYRSFSICSETSIPYSEDSIRTAPASLYHKGQPLEGISWRRPQNDIFDNPPIVTSVAKPARNHNDSSTSSSVKLLGADNELSAHLANLMSSNFTMAPSTVELHNLAHRAMPIQSLSSSSRSENSSLKKGKIRSKRLRPFPRSVHTIKISSAGMSLLRTNSRMESLDENKSV